MRLPFLFALFTCFASMGHLAQPTWGVDSKTHRFTFRLPGDPETLDWNRAHTPIENYLLGFLMEGLVSLDTDLKVKPALAESWTVSPDGKTYVFKLKNGVKWSDGVPLKAQDFVYSWKRLLSPETAAAYAYFLFDIEGAEAFNRGDLRDFEKVGISAVDDGTLRVRLHQRTSQWIYTPSFWVTFPLRQDAVEKVKTAWDVPGKMVTLGPYLLTTREFDSKIILKANPLYHGERGMIDEIVGQVIVDSATALNLYESGKLDLLTDISSVDLKRLENRPDLKIFPYLKTVYLGFVTGILPFSDVHLRRAVAMSIDKTKFADFLHGKQVAAGSFVPPPLLGNSGILGLPFDPVKGRKELEIFKKGKDALPRIRLLVPNLEKSLTLAEYIQNELKRNLNLEIQIESFDNKTFRNRLDSRTLPMFIMSWSADFPDPDNFLSLFLSDSGNNRTLWKNPSYDSSIVRARGLNKRVERERIYAQLQELLLKKEAVVVPLYYEPNIALVNPHVKNLELSPLNYLNLKKVKLEL